MIEAKLKRKLFEELMVHPAIVTKNKFMYVSGYSGFDFFDSDHLSLSPETSSLISSIYVNLIQKLVENGIKINKLAFLEKSGGTVGPITLTAMISKETGLDAVVIRRRVPCLCDLCRSKLRVKGADIKPLSSGDSVVLMEDVATTGNTIDEAARIVEASGARVAAAVVLLDREMGADQRLEKMNIKLFSVLKRTELVELGFIPPTEKDVSSLDFLSDIGKTLSLSKKELTDIQNNLDHFVEKILKNKGLEATEENKKIMRNLLLAFTFGLRTKAPHIRKMES